MANIKLLSFGLLSIIQTSILTAQIGIGTTSPHSSAVLELESEEKGFLPPRLTTQERDVINSPAAGLMIYNLDDKCLNIFNSTIWVNICSSSNSGGGSQPGNSNIPENFLLQANNTIYISSVYDENYFPYTQPTTLANTGQSAPDGTPEAKIIDFQGTLTTTGLTVKIPYLVFGTTDILLDTITQTKTVIADHIEGGGSTVDIQLQIPGGNYSPGAGFIDANLKAITTNLNAKKLDINEGMGTDFGILISEFVIPVNNTGDTDTLQVKIIPAIPDAEFGDGLHDFVYLPVQAEDGNVWLTNNLGAEYANINSSNFSIGNKATALNDEKSYGSKYQWGRKSDEHELMNYTSSTVGNNVNPSVNNAISNTSTPTHSNFIRNNSSPYDWLSPQNDNLWKGNNAPNNPCPNGFRLPTQTEWSNYRSVSGINTNADAASTALAISSAGWINDIGAQNEIGTTGYYWAGNSTQVNIAGSNFTKAWSYFFNSAFSNASANNNVFGYSVRCIQNNTNISSTSQGTAIIQSVNDCNVASTGSLDYNQQVANGVTQTINVTVSKAGTYQIYAFTNGVQFSGNGILNLGSQDIVLTAVSNPYMKPTQIGANTFSLNIPSGCTFVRHVGI
jgi:uncharacterized protein (TIGR02145 family)